RVWPAVFVSDASLARVVNEVREGLGDRARPGHIVRTVHGYGYAFAAQAETDLSAPLGTELDQLATCWLISRDKEFALRNGEHIVGRDSGADVWLDSPKVSRRHARLIVDGTAATIEDLVSKNGTFVREVRIGRPTRLETGDPVRIGPFRFVFRTG